MRKTITADSICAIQDIPCLECNVIIGSKRTRWCSEICGNIGRQFKKTPFVLSSLDYLVQQQIDSDFARFLFGSSYYAVNKVGDVFTRFSGIGPDYEKHNWRKMKYGTAGSNREYQTVQFGVKKRWDIHRLVLATFSRMPLKGEDVRHLDGNPSNNSLENLAFGSRKDNMQDAIRHGTTCKGTKNARAILDEKAVLEIRNLCALKNTTMKKIGEAYGVSVECVSQIHRKTRWGWL